MPRDASAQSARLSSQFIARNRATLGQLGTTVEPHYDGSTVSLQFHATTKVGAVPLVSPTSGQIEYGLVVRPRFDWPGIGPMLADMGWRVIPAPLALPLLPRSERKVPPWVLSAIVLFRIEALLNQLTRRFELVEEHRSAPRGTVDWSNYAVRQMPRAQFTSVPCRFPDLRDDRALRSAIRFTLQKQFDSLAGQSSAGVFVIQLIELCNSLIERVRDAPPHPPTALQFDAWLRSPLKSSAFFDGLQAVQWTVDERGLGGLSDLEGLPWRMSMEQFFEAWVEAVLIGVSRRIGGTVRSGRERQTLTPIEWEPPYVGSQKSLVPDLLLDRTARAASSRSAAGARLREHYIRAARDPLSRVSLSSGNVAVAERARALVPSRRAAGKRATH